MAARREVRGTFTLSVECNECHSRETHLTIGLPVVPETAGPAKGTVELAPNGRGSVHAECAGCGRTVKQDDLPVRPAK